MHARSWLGVRASCRTNNAMKVGHNPGITSLNWQTQLWVYAENEVAAKRQSKRQQTNRKVQHEQSNKSSQHRHHSHEQPRGLVDAIWLIVEEGRKSRLQQASRHAGF